MNNLNIRNKINKLLKLISINGLSSILSFITTIIIARNLGPSDFGLYSSVLIYSSFFIIFLNFGTEQYSTAIFKKNSSNLINTISEITVIRLFLFLTTLILFLPYSLLDDNYLFLGIFIAISSFNLSFVFEIKDDNETYAFVFLFERFCILLSILILFFLDLNDYRYIFLIISFFSILSLIYQFNFFDFKFSYLSIKNIKLISLISLFIITLHNLSSFAYSGFSRLIISEYISSSDFGILSAMWQFTTISMIIQAQVSRVWRPNLISSLINKKYYETLKYIKELLIFTTFPTILLSIFFWFIAEKVIFLFFGDKYQTGSVYFSAISVYMIVINLSSIAEIIYIGLNHVKFYFLVNFLFGLALLLTLILFHDSINPIIFCWLIVFYHGLSVIFLILFFKFRLFIKV